MLGGQFSHEDSCGNSGKWVTPNLAHLLTIHRNHKLPSSRSDQKLTIHSLSVGDVQWMTAGKGIVHGEMPVFDPDPSKSVDAVGIQLWVDLPKDKRFCEPSYQEKKAKERVSPLTFWLDEIPRANWINSLTIARPVDGVEIVVVSGKSHGSTVSPIPDWPLSCSCCRVQKSWLIRWLRASSDQLEDAGSSISNWINLESRSFNLFLEAGQLSFIVSPFSPFLEFLPLFRDLAHTKIVINGQVQVGDDKTIHEKFNTLVLSSKNGQEGVKLRRPENGTDNEDTQFVLIAGEPLD